MARKGERLTLAQAKFKIIIPVKSLIVHKFIMIQRPTMTTIKQREPAHFKLEKRKMAWAIEMVT